MENTKDLKEKEVKAPIKVTSNICEWESIADYYNTAESKCGVVEFGGEFQSLLTLLKGVKFSGYKTSKIYDNPKGCASRCSLFVYVNDFVDVLDVREIVTKKYKFVVEKF